MSTALAGPLLRLQMRVEAHTEQLAGCTKQGEEALAAGEACRRLAAVQAGRLETLAARCQDCSFAPSSTMACESSTATASSKGGAAPSAAHAAAEGVSAVTREELQAAIVAAAERARRGQDSCTAAVRALEERMEAAGGAAASKHKAVRDAVVSVAWLVVRLTSHSSSRVVCEGVRSQLSAALHNGICD